MQPPLAGQTNADDPEHGGSQQVQCLTLTSSPLCWRVWKTGGSVECCHRLVHHMHRAMS